MKKLILILSILTTGCSIHHRDEQVDNGMMVGYVTEQHPSGFFCKTWEVTMKDLMHNFDYSKQPEFAWVGRMHSAHFTLEDPKLMDLLREAQMQIKMVEIEWKTEPWSFCRSDSNSRFITKITPREKIENLK